VASYYLDASALVKRYAAEIGTTWVRVITSPSAGHSVIVALISGAEVVAAIAKRGRMQSLSSIDARQAISDFGRVLSVCCRLNFSLVARCAVMLLKCDHILSQLDRSIGIAFRYLGLITQ
jgi:predicted nucleic acid-binding protein